MTATRHGRLVPPPAVRGVVAATALLMVVFLVSVIPGVRGDGVFHDFYDGWVQGAAYVAIALVAALRPLLVREDRVLWTVVAAAVALRGLGFVVFLGFVRRLDPQPYPSAADVLWLAMPVVMLAGLALIARPAVRAVTTGVVLDAIVGACAAAAVAIAAMWGTLERLTGPEVTDADVVVNLAYPITDLMLLVAVLGVLTMHRWRPGPAVWVLGAGLAGFAVTDGAYLYEFAHGTYHPGTLLAALSLVSTALTAAAAWLPRRRDPVLSAGAEQLWLSALFSLACLGLLVFDDLHAVPFGAVAFAAAGVALGTARTVVAFREALGMSRRLAAVLDGARDYAVMGGRQGELTFFSRGAEEMLGYRAEEVVGRVDPASFLDQEELAERMKLGRPSELIAPPAGQDATSEWTYVHRDGHRIPVALTLTRLADGEFIGVARDITAERRAARYRAVREALVRVLAGEPDLDRSLQQALKTVVDGMAWDLGALWLRDGDALHPVALWGSGDVEGLRRATAGLRLAEGEGLAGKAWAAGETQWIEDLRGDETLTAEQAEILERWGRDLASVASTPIRSGDERRVLGVLQVFGTRPAPRDDALVEVLETIAAALGHHIETRIGERQLEVALLEAERANRTMSEFVSRISHELRTPLNAILGFAQILDRRLPGREEREQVDQIATAGAHLLELIDDLLDLGQLERGEIRLAPEPVSATDVLRSVLDLVRPLVHQRDLELDVDMHGGLYAYVSADYQRLRQVLLNLLANAVKYNRPGGRIELSFAEPSPDRLRFVVSDTGPGIAEADLPRLFRPFDRLGAERGSESGTGLGLPVSQGLVHAMGGELGLESRLGEGTTFWVELDRVPAPAPVLAPAPAETPSPNGVPPDLAGTVLYIEDNPSNLKLVADVLTAHPDVELLTATVGRAGISLAARRQPELVLLDAQLPDLDGEQVLELLSADPATADIPVVVLSADATEARRRSLLDRGAAGYVEKPFELDEFLRVVAGALGR